MRFIESLKIQAKFVFLNKWKRCFFMFASYIKRCLFADVKLGLLVGMTKQIMDGKEVDILDIANC